MNPLNGLYGAATALRNMLFDRGILAAHRLERPVVSVGNLSTGGMGKTPFVIALGELFNERGITFDVLSRGYGRKTRGVFVVDPAGRPSDFGDEPLLIARKLGIPVIVGESRYEAGKVAEKKFQNQLHLLDDGFQHRSLARDFDIVLMGPGDFEDRLLPGGRLREPLSSLIRADAVVLPQDVETEGRAICGKSVWRMRREMSLANIPKSPVVFCGLARPEQFFAQVRAMGVVRAAETIFPDHHAYTPDDIQIILGASRKHGAGGFITTEKDAINLGDLASTLTPLSIVELKMTLDRPADLVNTIMARIAGRMPCS